MRSLVPIAVLLLTLAAAEAVAEPRIRELEAHEADGRISVSFRLDEAFDDPDIRKAIESGLPTVLRYEIVLLRKYPNWFDDTIATSMIEVVATYNSVTREYLLNYRRDRRLVRSQVLSSLDELKRRMATINEPELFGTEGRKPWKLRVRVRAELMRRYVWYLIPWDVSTPWEETRVESLLEENGETP
ncbi:MAG: DUF4390 domain-containing protein [Thermoanaerobaculia bacterium]